MREFRLPDVGEGISEAEVLEWLVDPGDTVDEGQPIVEISTDKVTTELPSPVAGTVAELAAAAGDIVEVGEVLVRFEVADQTDDAQGGDEAERAADGPQGPDDGDAATAPASRADGGPTSRSDAGAVASSADAGDDATNDGAAARAERRGRPVAAPSVRRMAAERDIDLTGLEGSGPGGRILRADLDLDRVEVGEPATTSRRQGEVTREPLTGQRAVTARTMQRASASATMTTSTFEVDGDGILALVDLVTSDEQTVTPTAVVGACVADALTSHPRLNAVVEDDGSVLALHQRVDLAIAVATDQGLTTPVVRDAASLRLRDLAARLSRLASEARAGTLAGSDQTDGTFTLSSTGGIERVRMVSTQPVLNVPQVGCLWVSRIVSQPRVGPSGDLEVGPVMTCSFTFDHRFVDGAEATAFMNDLGALLTEPVVAIA